jgi:hypothetical protein
MDGCDALPDEDRTAGQYRDESTCSCLQPEASNQHYGCEAADGGDPIALIAIERRSFANFNGNRRKRAEHIGGERGAGASTRLSITEMPSYHTTRVNSGNCNSASVIVAIRPIAAGHFIQRSSPSRFFFRPLDQPPQHFINRRKVPPAGRGDIREALLSRWGICQLF